MDHEQFFMKHGDEKIDTRHFARSDGSFTVEELYQAFKERYQSESQSDGLAAVERLKQKLLDCRKNDGPKE